MAFVPALLLAVASLTGCAVTSASSDSQQQAAPAQLSVNPSSVAFGNTPVGNTGSNHTIAISNSGGSSLTLSQANVSGAGFTIGGLSLPLTLGPGQSASFSISFAPTAAGSVSGSVSLVSDAPNSPTMITLSGSGVQSQLSVVPGSVAFGNVVVATTNTQTVTISNAGTIDLNISQVTVSGAGFSTTGVSLPIALSPGQKTSFNVAFTPTGTGSITGILSLVSDAPDSPTTVSLSGTGVAATYQLSVNPTSLSFGSVAVGSSSSQTATLSNSGNSSVTISQVSVSGAGFSASGVAAPLTLDPGQSVTLTVTFAPTTSGSVTGSVSIASNASNSPATISLSGSGGSTTAHSVSLNWTASSSVVVGYNVYRATLSGGPYSKVNSSLISGISFTDSTVQAGQTYFYVTTAVDSSSNESIYSNEVSATIPSP